MPKDGLAFTNFYAAQLYGKVAYHDFEGITVQPTRAPHPEERRGRPVLLLRNHGPVTIGRTLPQACADVAVNRACEIQLAMQGKGETIPISRAVLEHASPTRCSSIRSTAPARLVRRPAAAGRPEGPELPDVAAPARASPQPGLLRGWSRAAFRAPRCSSRRRAGGRLRRPAPACR